ncbi:hypothetical protein TUM4644_00650 [Shewanella colwelliana]|nr:hypothetical protein TUM4644_00650 [Shewanella colwelliana]
MKIHDVPQILNNKINMEEEKKWLRYGADEWRRQGILPYRWQKLGAAANDSD